MCSLRNHTETRYECHARLEGTRTPLKKADANLDFAIDENPFFTLILDCE